MKTHLNYKVDGQLMEKALCGNNGRRYTVAERTVRPKVFRALPKEEQCQHCVREYLRIRNLVRKTKGLPPVKHAFEGQLT